MKTFDEVYAIADKVFDARTFSRDEARRYWELLSNVPIGGTVVEIGLQFGRTSSIVAQVALERDLHHVGIDPFIDPPQARDEFIPRMKAFGHKFDLINKFSEQSGPYLPNVINLGLIDGDHRIEGVEKDINLLAPRMANGGVLLFHDYGYSLPNVMPPVSPAEVKVRMPAGWTELPVVDTLGVWIKG